MSKKVILGYEGRKKLINGVNTLSDAVKVTLGAKGRNVIIGDQYGNIRVTKDGVSVAQSIVLEDNTENMGASLIKEVASKTVDVSGDGTTTATILAQAIINYGIKAVESGCNPVDLKRGIDNAVIQIVQNLKDISKPIDNDDSLKHIASVSANNDSVIGELIASAISKVGRDGLITVEESKSYDTKINIVEGMKIDRGYLSHHFITNEAKMECELINPYILICDKKISVMNDVLSFLEKAAKENRPLLIIAEDLDGEALATLIVNKMRGIIQVCAIKSPDFGDNRKFIMEDISLLVNGTFVSEEKGTRLDSCDLEVLGEAAKVIINKDNCIIIGGAGSRDNIDNRCKVIKTQIADSDSEFQKEKLKSRLAKLKNGIAVLSIGGVTETEIREKKDRIEDALCATRSAIEEGFVSGGGTAYLNAIKKLILDSSNDDENIGMSIIKKALESPFRQLLFNGGVEPSYYINQINDAEYGIGFNIKTNTLENLFDSGIIDPTKVVRVALENAASIASIFLTTECVISEKNKEDEN